MRRKAFHDPPTERNRVWQTDFSEFEQQAVGSGRGELELVDENTGEVIDVVPAPIAVVSDNGSCFRGETSR